MKIVISHDVDHLSVKEHVFKDLIIPKYILWSLLELAKRKISFETFYKKITGLFKKDGWNSLEELLKFDEQNKVNPTFFLAVNNGKGLSYSIEQAKTAIDLIKKYNFDFGLHGICYDDYGKMKEEYEDFKKISGLSNFGVRMHYLRLNENTLKNLAKLGYIFDSTILSDDLRQEYKINGLTEMPFHIMDSELLNPIKNLTLKGVKNRTIEILNQAERENKKYIAILFHQRYFSEEFPDYRKWYLWFINFSKEKKHEFINYKNLL